MHTQPSSSEQAPLQTDLEITLLLEAVCWQSGLDFRGFSPTPVKLAIDRTCQALRVATITGLLDRVVHHTADLQLLLANLQTILPKDERTVSASWRSLLLPLLRSTPFPKLWLIDYVNARYLHLLVTLLVNEKLFDDCTIFITTTSPAITRTLRTSLRILQPDLTTAIDRSASENLIWSEYDLNNAASFNEFEFISCGHSLHDLAPQARRRLLRSIRASLAPCGLLELPTPDPLDIACLEPLFLPLPEDTTLFRHARVEKEAQRRSGRCGSGVRAK